MIKRDIHSVSSEEGFSLVELLVVLSLLGLVSAFVTTAWFYAERAVTEWRSSMRLENELQTLAEGVAGDIYKAETIHEVGVGSISLMISEKSERYYEIQKGRLLRNGKAISGKEMKVMQFTIKEFSGTEKNSTDGTLIKLQLVLSNGQDTLSTERAVHLRKPANWKLLGGN